MKEFNEEKLISSIISSVKELPDGSQVRKWLLGEVFKDVEISFLEEKFQVSRRSIYRWKNSNHNYIKELKYPVNK